MLLVIPVVIIHRGNHGYVRDVVAQAKKHAEQVVVLGDGQDFATDNVSDYYETAREFEKVYEHLSTNGYDIELMCFTRWMVLNEFMAKKGVEVCLHIDSDVLIYEDPEVMWLLYDQFEMTLSHRCCGSAAFFTYRGLDKFCNFVWKTYSRKDSYDYARLRGHFETRQRHGLPGGVCDMTLLEHYGYKYCGEVGEMMHITGNSTWDHNINESDQGFLMDPATNIKRVTIIKGKPVVDNEILGRPIRFNSLHFQGPAKQYLQRYLTP